MPTDDIEKAREWGAQGGQRTFESRGKEYMAAIGRRGGLARARKAERDRIRQLAAEGKIG